MQQERNDDDDGDVDEDDDDDEDNEDEGEDKDGAMRRGRCGQGDAASCPRSSPPRLPQSSPRLPQSNVLAEEKFEIFSCCYSGEKVVANICE